MTIDNLPVTRQESLLERQEYAKALAVSSLLPPEYRANPGNVLYAIEFGRSIGVDPIVAITEVHVIKGKPSSSAGLVSALVRAAGHKMRTWVERDDQGRLTKAVSTIHRKDDPDFEFRSEWNIARAQTAGLLKQNENYGKYPEGMLIARSQTEVARMACKEALCGLGYTPEELGAEVTEDGAVVVTAVQPRVSPPGQTIRQAVSAPATDALDSADAPRMISPAQQKKMGALMREAGITERDAALAFVAKVIGRTVGSRNELTLDEAKRVIDALEAPTPPPAVTAEDEEPVDAEIVELDEAERLMSLIVGEWEKLGGTKAELTTVFQDAVSVGHREASEAQLQTFLDQLRAGEHLPKAAQVALAAAAPAVLPTEEVPF